MPYVVPQDLISAFGEDELVQLTDRAQPPAREVDLAVAQRACDRAVAEINGHLAARYTLPLTRVPELLRFIGQDLARFYLFDVEPTSVVQTRFDVAQKTLRAIASGAQSLGLDADGLALADAPQALAEFNVGQKVFGREACR